jgi:hypothetical protein
MGTARRQHDESCCRSNKPSMGQPLQSRKRHAREPGLNEKRLNGIEAAPTPLSTAASVQKSPGETNTVSFRHFLAHTAETSHLAQKEHNWNFHPAQGAQAATEWRDRTGTGV